MDFTVAIPTYNGQQRLPDVLERLRSQRLCDLAQGFSWEVLVIDNHSRDQTAAVVQQFQADFPVPLRCCSEPRQGVGYARQTAIEQATSDLVGFLDDDNLPDLDWVAAAYQFAHTHPQAGAYGSRIRGDFAEPPAANLRRILPFLAITERGTQPLKYEPRKKLLPPAAGLVVRRQSWLDAVPPVGVLAGLGLKRSDGNDCGEDLEVLLYLQRSDWEIWYNPAMQIAHKIPAWRLERAYLIPLFRSIGRSRYITRMLSVASWQRPAIFWVYLLNDLRKVVWHYLKYRTQLETDIAAACEMQLFLSSLVSPFLFWQKRYFSKFGK